ncbi:MAG: hypothetical protein KDB01_22990, partial [Planctomycetaceae bacterium]|nr:hypothetical protein [Planctomycetaceae bacterium]
CQGPFNVYRLGIRSPAGAVELITEGQLLAEPVAARSGFGERTGLAATGEATQSTRRSVPG